MPSDAYGPGVDNYITLMSELRITNDLLRRERRWRGEQTERERERLEAGLKYLVFRQRT